MARFAFDDLVQHKKQRTWSLRFARNLEIKHEGELTRAELQLVLQQKAALKLQVGWLRRALPLLEQRLEDEGGYEKMLPTLFGKLCRDELLHSDWQQHKHPVWNTASHTEPHRERTLTFPVRGCCRTCSKTRCPDAHHHPGRGPHCRLGQGHRI